MSDEEKEMWERLQYVDHSTHLNRAIDRAIIVARYYKISFKDAMDLPVDAVDKLAETIINVS